MHAQMEEAAIAGLAVAVIRDSPVALAKTYGYADVERRQPVTADTPFNIASISKPVLGIILLQLAAAGRLDLDRDINEYLHFTGANPHARSAPITVRQLATHTAGIADNDDPTPTARMSILLCRLKITSSRLLTPGGRGYGNRGVFSGGGARHTQRTATSGRRWPGASPSRLPASAWTITAAAPCSSRFTCGTVAGGWQISP